MTAKERKQLKEAGFEWGQCDGCYRTRWLGQTMNVNKPWQTDYLVPESHCYSCMGHESAEKLLEYC